MSFALGSMLIIAGVGLAGQAISNNKAKKMAEKDAQQAASDRGRWDRELSRLKKNRPALKNPYGDMTNPFANLTNPYAKLTNQYANLGVATQAAEFQAEQADIALANTLDSMAATGMGAGGATTLARAALQSKKSISADIQKQEAENQKLSAKGAMDVAEKKAMGQSQIEQMKAQGAMQVQQMKGQGAQWMMGVEEGRSQQDMNNASGMMMNYMQMGADANAAQIQSIMSTGAAFGSAASGVASSGAVSDRRLKEDIKIINISPSGLNIYNFKYKDKDRYGDYIYQGVMSDEIPSNAVIVNNEGFDTVDYSKIDVNFIRL